MLEALFVAVAKVAPAATAAANNGDDWKWLVPVATLILGFGLKWLQDHLTEKGRRRHERDLRREQRYDALRMRRLEAERGNLLTMQPLAVGLLRAGRRLSMARSKAVVGNEHLSDVGVDPDLEAEPGRLASELLQIRARLHTAKVVGQFDEFLGAFWKALDAETDSQAIGRWEVANETYRFLAEAIGSTIKALEDENQQLGEPLAR